MIPSTRSPLALLVFALLALSVVPSFGQTTTRVSISSTGIQANNPSFSPSIAADGRCIAFESYATNLVSGDSNGVPDVFVRDLQAGTTRRISVATGGLQANDKSFTASVSADCRLVAFASSASNLVAGDTNGFDDVFVHDLVTGLTARVSIASDGTQGNNNSAVPGGSNVALSGNGRFVAFSSSASNLAAGDTNNTRDMFVHDRTTSVTTRVSVNTDGSQRFLLADDPSISADGRYVAFAWTSPYFGRIFVHDRQAHTTMDESNPPCICSGIGASLLPSLSPDGRFVAFSSSLRFLIEDDTNESLDMIVRDIATDEMVRASMKSDGSQSAGGDPAFTRPSLSTLGRSAAFSSYASDLVADDTNNSWDIFVHDFDTGNTTRVSVATDGSQRGSPASISSDPVISADGRFVAFVSTVDNLVANDTNNYNDIFVRDRGIKPLASPTLFEFSEITSPQTVGVPFPVTIIARTQGQASFLRELEVTLSSTSGGLSPLTVQLRNGRATISVAVDSPGTGVAISAFGHGISGKSNEFDVQGGAVTTGALAGHVHTLHGSAVAGATVMLNTDGVTDSRVSGPSGEFSFSGKACQAYTLSAITGDGLVTNTFRVQISCGRTVTADLLIPGSNCNPEGLTPILLIPGILGSATPQSTVYPELPTQSPSSWNDQSVWGTWNFNTLRGQPAGLHDPLNQVGWRDLVSALEQVNDKYKINCTVFPVPWDWRMSVDDVAAKYLIPAIDYAKLIAGAAKVHIIAHSMGGLVTRSYIQSDAYPNRDDIDRFAMVGTPNSGSANAFLLWQGGDPLAADRLAGDPIHFYTESSQRAFTRLMGRPPSFDPNQVGQTPSFYQDMAYLYHTKVPSLLQLEPLWDVLEPNGALQCSPRGDIKWHNEWLKALNNSPHRLRMVPENGSSTSVRTKIFAGGGQQTIYKLPSGVRDCNTEFFPDGRPHAAPAGQAKDMIALLGDGTVPLSSAYGGFGPSALGATVTFDGSKNGVHKSLLKTYQCDILEFLVSASCASSVQSSPSLASTSPGLLSIGVRGRPQPYLMAPNGSASGINPITGELEATITDSSVNMQPDYGVIGIVNPLGGTYSITVSALHQEDFTLEFSYFTADGTNESISVVAFYSAPTTINFSFDAAATQRISINHAPDSPSGLQADPMGELTRLSWDAHPDTLVTSYNVYSKLDGEPKLQRIGTAFSTSFEPGHSWADTLGEPVRIYSISSVYANGAESFLAPVILNNDRDHDGVEDRVEALQETIVTDPDTDDDGLTDGEERYRGTSALLADTDGDGITDGQEVAANSDPLSAAAIPGLQFFTVPPCRLIDTRGATGPLGGPVLQSQSVRVFKLGGTCGVPITARALAVNITAIQPTATGHLNVYPADKARPNTSSVNFGAGQIRANNAIVLLSANTPRELAVFSSVLAAGQVHLLMDVNGYFDYSP